MPHHHSFHRTLAAFALCTAAFSHAQQPAPDTLFVHGDILTGAHLTAVDPSRTPARVQALAVREGRVLAVGDDATILALRGPQTTVVDLHGAFAMPGFNDAHTHMAQAGEQRLTVNLVGAGSLADMQGRIRTYVATAKPGQWVLGGGWDHTLWPGKRSPTAPTSTSSPAITPPCSTASTATSLSSIPPHSRPRTSRRRPPTQRGARSTAALTGSRPASSARLPRSP